MKIVHEKIEQVGDDIYKTVKIKDLMTEYYKNGELHRDDDKPAIIYLSGSKIWYQNGKIHREDGKPAVVEWNGIEKYFLNGREYEEIYYQNDVLHRDGDLPAIIYKDGSKEYYKNGNQYFPKEENTPIKIEVKVETNHKNKLEYLLKKIINKITLKKFKPIDK